MPAIFSMINPIQAKALTVLSGGVLTLASLVSSNPAEAAPGYSTFFKSEVEQVKERQDADIATAKAKGQAAHQSIQKGGWASPKKDGYGSMTKAQKEAYKAGFRGE